MPELPEVETTRRGVAPHVEGRSIQAVRVREARLRWPIAESFGQDLTGRLIFAVERRAKYLLFRTTTATGKQSAPKSRARKSSVRESSASLATLMVHLGMSGSLRVVTRDAALQDHDHVDFELDGGAVLRYRDPRRFGSMFFVAGDAADHSLLASLGPEPLSTDFDGDVLFDRSRARKIAVKPFLMDAHIVVGVGNIYANEALFLSGIRPDRPAGSISRKRYAALADNVKVVLRKAIEAGGTTLRDFVREDGSAGYFRHELLAYGRGGEPCLACGRKLKEVVLGQRATVFCTRCQS